MAAIQAGDLSADILLAMVNTSTHGVHGAAPTQHQYMCNAFHHLNVSDVCAFVNATEDCRIREGFIDYTMFTYCTFRQQLVPLAITIMFFWLAFMFVALGVSADSFFCPALVVIAKTLRLSDNIAGVTLLAFGNGAADVFAAIAAVLNARDGDVGLAFGALLGAGVFLTTVVAGTVIVVRPFKMMERPFLRDVIFYIATVFMTFCVLYDQKITTVEAICYIVFYVVYVIVVLVARIIYQRHRHTASQPGPGLNRLVWGQICPCSTINAADDAEISTSQETPGGEEEEGIKDDPGAAPYHYPNGHGGFANHQRPRSVSTVSDADDDDPLLDLGPEQPEAVFGALGLLKAISPVNAQEWRGASWFSKVIIVFKVPALLILTLTVPVVDYDDPDKHKWNRNLNSLHCLTAPLMSVFLIRRDDFVSYIGGVFPVWAVILLAGSVLALIVFCTSSPSKQPVYHWVFAYLGFAVAVMWIEAIANEIVNLLQTVGIIFNLSNAILGLTFLAWGNSVADLVADIAMARQGKPRTAISACYGGPMFNLLLGIGIPFTYLCATSEEGFVKLHLSLIQIVLISSLLFALAASIVLVPFVLRFQMTRRFSVFLFAVYGVFLTVAILVETHVIRGRWTGP